MAAAAAYGQQSGPAADFSGEGTRFSESCLKFSIGGCADLLFTDHPLHIAVGSMAPNNGFAAGPSVVFHWTTPNWRISGDADGVVSNNLSWRAGVYVTAIYTKRPPIGVTIGGPAPAPSPTGEREAPVIHAYTQTESLKTLGFFGEGPNTSDTARSYFGMRETIAGANASVPTGIPGVAVFGEANVRAVDIRPDLNQSSPSIGQLYTDATAPGLSNQPTFAQLGEGLRIAPEFFGTHLRFNWAFTLQQYVPGGGSPYSFQRFTMDLNQQWAIYKTTRTLQPRPGNGPNDCTIDPTTKDTDKCPAVIANDKEGSISLRLLMMDSIASGGNVVPFYFQPTLGGSDINNSMALASYQNYRFRAPNAMLARATFEHSIWKVFGVSAMVDEGKVANRASGLDFTHLLHSYAAGLTLRAGGFPMVYLMFAWGGHEGTHNIVNVNSSLLGGAARPSLY
jgi:hypothetical protein